MTKKQFEKMKPAKRRVKVAEDVIATLRLPKRKRFKPMTGSYCVVETPKDGFFRDKGDDQIQSLLPKIERHCQVCGVGAMFISYVRLFDRLKLEDVGPDIFAGEAGLCVAGESITEALHGTFSAVMLNDIEGAFESNWKTQFPSDKKRLIAICENIVTNKGDFRIEEVPEK